MVFPITRASICHTPQEAIVQMAYTMSECHSNPMYVIRRCTDVIVVSSNAINVIKFEEECCIVSPFPLESMYQFPEGLASAWMTTRDPTGS